MSTEGSAKTEAPTALADEVRALRAEVARLNAQKFFRSETSVWRVAGWSLLRGLMFGLGSVLGATILLSVLVRLLGSIDFVPVLGDFAARIIAEIQAAGPRP